MEDKISKKEIEIESMNDNLYNLIDITELEQRLEFGPLWGCEPIRCDDYFCGQQTS